jgi:tRNA pseudouridine65 synthase
MQVIPEENTAGDRQSADNLPLPAGLPEVELADETPPHLPVLYQDEALVAIHKPSGLLVHRTGLDAGERWFAVQLLRDQLGGRHVYPVHRLDKGTSGVLVFALSSSDAAAVAAQFAAHTIGKRYLAVVRGWPPEAGTIDHPLTHETKDPQPALTRYRTLERITLPLQADRYPESRYALVEACPETGRTHQIRRHLKHLGHPIAGDTTHGVGAHNRLWRSAFGCHRMLLACTGLGLLHPRSGAPLVLEAAPAESFARPLAEARRMSLESGTLGEPTAP